MRVGAVIFDLHHTLTSNREDPTDLYRKMAKEYRIQLGEVSDLEFREAVKKADVEFSKILVKENAPIHYGGKPEHWLETDRRIFEALGVSDLRDEEIIEFERKWKHETTQTDFEKFTDDGMQVLKELNERELELGISTRRHDDPRPFLKREGVLDYFSSVQWSGVSGYAKPSPYTLIIAAHEMRVNPKRCMFIGNYVGLDVGAAKRAGMIPVLLTWANPDEAAKADDETIVLESPLEILNHL